MSILFYKKINKLIEIHFSWRWQKKVLVCSKMPKKVPLNTLKLFLAKRFFFFFFLHSWKMPSYPFIVFLQNKTHMLSKVCLNLKQLNIGLKITYLFHGSPKTVFWSQIWFKNLQKKPKGHPKRNMSSDFFILKLNISIWKRMLWDISV